MEEKRIELDFEKLFKTAFWFLYHNGGHPSLPKDWKWLIKFSFFHGFLYTIQVVHLIYSTVFHDLRNNVLQASGNVSLMTVYFLVTLMYGSLVKYQDSFLSMIATMKKHYAEAHTLPIEEQKVMERYAANGRFCCLFWCFLTTSCLVGFCFLPLVTMTYTSLTGNFKYNPVVDLAYPAFFYEFDEQTLFWSNYIYSTYWVIYSIFMYMCVMPMGPVFMLHACGQLGIMEIQVNQLFTDKNMTEEERAERIKIIAIKSHEVFDFVDLIQTCFQVLYELLLKGSSIVLPFLLFLVSTTLNTPEFKMEFAVLLLGCVPVSSSPCYYGEILMEKGTEFGETVYSCGWENIWDKNARRSLLLIMLRMERKVAIQSIFRVICLTTLTDVFHSAYAIFSLLNAAWN